MQYEHIKTGIFLERPNRFIALVQLGKDIVTCHVKNTGRCKELLIPGTRVLVQYHPHAEALGRKTHYSLISVYKICEKKEPLLINMDSQAPNQAALEWLSGMTLIKHIRREIPFGSSRFDLAFEYDGKPCYMEVKGVTLEEHGIARFPDAPTLRGLKHVEELTAMAKDGLSCFLLFVIQMKPVICFEPNIKTHPEFGPALSIAHEAGVRILAFDCLITENSMTIDSPIPIYLPGLSAPLTASKKGI
ncbi:DNA/RNA nuclease SfsA [Lachnospiraceae bacterium 62-35]